MKIAIYGESDADENAVELLINAILGAPIKRSPRPALLTRGWTQMLAELPRIIRALHYGSDADALVVIADSNGHAIHESTHDAPGKSNPDCRLCALRQVAQRELSRLKTRPSLPPLRVAIGLPVPALEAWLLSHRHGGLTEAMIKAARLQHREDYPRVRLKELLYGTARPTLQLEIEKMLEAMNEIIGDLPRLRTAFPGGFGPLFDEIVSWK
jgi:hypothetical protein